MTSPSSRLLTLPQELLDAIIGNLLYDRDTLLACSLVAKPFNQATRSHLFAKTTVRLDHLGKLSELRTATHSTISQCIRRLVVAIDERISSNEVDVRTYTKEIEKFDFSGMQHLGVSYNTHKYRETEYKGMVGYLHSETLGYDVFQSVLTRVTHLTIGDVTFDTLFTMQGLICAFTSLSTLELGYFECTGGEISDYISLIPEITLPPSLEKFSMEDTSRDPDQPDLLTWVLAHNPVPYVHTASFEYVQQLSRPLISQYLQAAGPSIKHLTLAVGCDCGPPSVFDLRKNVNLETLQLGTMDADWYYDDIYHLWLLNTLATISSPYVHTLVITHEVAYMGESSDPTPRHPNSLFPWKLDCARLDQTLADSPFFKILKRVEIRLGPATYPLAVKEDMPICDARGILSTSGARINVLGDDCRRPSSDWPYGLNFPS